MSTISPCVNYITLCYFTDYTQKRKLPPHHQAAVDVLQRCAPFLSSPSPSLRLTVLDTAEHCITTLRTDKVCPWRRRRRREEGAMVLSTCAVPYLSLPPQLFPRKLKMCKALYTCIPYLIITPSPLPTYDLIYNHLCLHRPFLDYSPA